MLFSCSSRITKMSVGPGAVNSLSLRAFLYFVTGCTHVLGGPTNAFAAKLITRGNSCPLKRSLLLSAAHLNAASEVMYRQVGLRRNVALVIPAGTWSYAPS